MPLDPSIALAARSPVALEDPLTQYAKAAQIKGMVDASALSGLQRQALQNQLSEHDRVLAAFNSLQPGQSIESVLPQVYQASPTTGIALQKNLLDARQAQSTIDKNTAATIATKLQTHRDMLGTVNDQPTYDAWRQGFVADLPGLANAVPPQYSPQTVQQLALKGDQLIERLMPKATMVDNGQAITPTNPYTQKPMGPAIQKQATPGEKLTDQRQRELNGILAGQTPVDNTPTVKAIASYETPLPPRPSGSRNPLAAQRWDALLASVKKENPDYNAQNYQASQRAYNAFTSGAQGNAIRSFSVAMSHLDTLQKLADALKNGDAQLINKFSNAYKEQTGQVAPTNFEAAKQIVADEVVKAIVGSGSGALGDREEAAKTIRSQSSPAQLAGTIGTYKELMAGQLSGLKRQYEQSTYRKDFDRFLSDEAKTQLERHTSPGAAAPAALPATNAQGWRLMTDAKGNRAYVSPDGKQFQEVH